MSLAAGEKLGPFEIGARLGVSGTGEMYRARDTRLERTLAIKILPARLSNGAVREQRFEREAKTIPSLNHPHICVLRDIGSQDGVDYLVMESQMNNPRMLTNIAAVAALACFLATPLIAQGPAGIREMYDGAMRPDVAVKTLENSDKLFPVSMVERGGAVRELPAAKAPLKNVHFEAKGKEYDLFDYLALNRVAGLLILKNGDVVLEDYELGIGPDTRWPSFSMAKSVSSTLIGAALQDGSITSLDDPVTKYVPSLKGGAYEGVTVRNVIQMASGVKWDETYTDPSSDRRKLLEIQLQKKADTILPFMSALPRAGAPGTIWNYNTGETFVVGAVVEGATHRSLATYLSERIWSRWGMEHEATWWLESPNGMVWGGGGLSATLRDFGRIGLLVLADGVIDGKRVVPQR
jgi:CubicO group peptidase (beta-lactamase class C family)